MIALLERAGRHGWVWLGGLALGCMGIGALAGVNPSYGLLVSLGLAFTAASFADVTLGLVMFTVLSFFETLTSNGGVATNLMKIAGLLLFASWWANTLTVARAARRRDVAVSPTFVVSAIVLLAWSALSVAWAESPGTALTSTSRYGLNLLLIPIVLGVVRRRQPLMYVVAAFVVGAVISAIYGFANPVSASASDSGRLAGSIGDPNEQAAVLVAAIPFALALAATLRRAPVLRGLAVAAALIALVGVITTLSRGGLIALGCVMLAAVVFGGRWRRWAMVLLILAVAGGAGYIFAIAPATSRARVTSGDTSGRSDIWTIGWRMVKANPLVGVGSGNFQVSSIHYLQQPGSIHSAQLVVNVPHVAHNIYLELLADMGIPGLLAFLGIVGAALAAATRAALESRRVGDRDIELIARSLVLAMVGFLASDFFLSGEYSKQLWLVVALCPAVASIARSRALWAVS